MNILLFFGEYICKGRSSDAFDYGWCLEREKGLGFQIVTDHMTHVKGVILAAKADAEVRPALRI